MKFSPAFIDEVKARNPIEEVVSSYVTLKRAGSNLTGLCPFHSEKTPSFSVSAPNGFFYCFGCGTGGDVISFIMKIENLDYPSAIGFLAKRAGLPLPENPDEKEQGVRRARVLAMNRLAAKYFHSKLMEGGAGLEYLTEKRKLPMPLIRHFGLGFAPDSFGELTNLLTRNGYSAEEMKTAFLCGISPKTGRPYDYFRNRVIFPIIDNAGEVIAFGGRVMDDSLPKYLNTSDTPAFRKSRNLFALNFAKKHCAETIILCEGYMDVIALHGAGFENAVATLGTALTSEQARIMKRYTKKVIISYDADEAGQRAADRAFGILGEVGLETRLLRVEGAKDPDEYIKKFGADRFRKLLEGSRTRFDFQLEGVLKRNNVAENEGKLKAAAEITSIIAAYPSEVERDVYIGQASAALSVPKESLKNDVNRAKISREKRETKEAEEKIMRETRGFGDRINPEKVTFHRGARAEEILLGILLLYPEMLSVLEKEGSVLTPDDLVTEFNRRVLNKLFELKEEDAAISLSLFAEDFSPDEMGKIAKYQIDREKLTDNGEDVVLDCVRIIKEEKAKKTTSLEDLLASKRQKKQDKETTSKG